MKRGQRVKSKRGEGTVLGPEDFEGYENNDPGKYVRRGHWVLVKWDDGHRSWIGDIWLEVI